MFFDEGFAGKKSNDKGGRSLFVEYPISYEDMYRDDDYDDDDDVLNDDDIDFDDDMDDASFEEYYYDFDDDDGEFMFDEDDQMSDKEIKEIRAKKTQYDKMTPEMREEEKKERKEKNVAQAKIMFDERKAHKAKRDEKREELLHGKNQRREMTGTEIDEKKMKAGEAFERTHIISTAGWYMLCVEATQSSITAELELRKSSDVGPPNRKTGHLQTYERHEMVQKERKLFEQGRTEAEIRKAAEVAAAQAVGDSNLPIPGAIEAEDLANSKSQMARLNRLLNSIKDKQTAERNRLSIHAALNEHSHSRMVLSSLFETVFYICVSGFQVYTIRKWFKGNAILGY